MKLVHHVRDTDDVKPLLALIRATRMLTTMTMTMMNITMILTTHAQ